jgi:hypothetical protein
LFTEGLQGGRCGEAAAAAASRCGGGVSKKRLCASLCTAAGEWYLVHVYAWCTKPLWCNGYCAQYILLNLQLRVQFSQLSIFFLFIVRITVFQTSPRKFLGPIPSKFRNSELN